MTCPCTVVCKPHKNAKAAWDVVEQLVDLLNIEAAGPLPGRRIPAVRGVTIPCNSLLAAQIRDTWTLIGRK